MESKDGKMLSPYGVVMLSNVLLEVEAIENPPAIEEEILRHRLELAVGGVWSDTPTMNELIQALEGRKRAATTSAETASKTEAEVRSIQKWLVFTARDYASERVFEKKIAAGRDPQHLRGEISGLNIVLTEINRRLALLSKPSTANLDSREEEKK